MQRRRFLALLGTAGIGGCTTLRNSDPQTTTQTTTSARTSTPSPTISVHDEVFDQSTLTYTVILDVDLDGSPYIEAKISGLGSDAKPHRVERYTKSGRKRLANLQPIDQLSFATPNSIPNLLPTHIIGSDDGVSFDPQPRFRDISFKTLPNPNSDVIERRYQWKFNGQQMAFWTQIPKSLHRYCQNRPRINSYGFYGGDTFNDGFLNHISKEFTNQTHLSERERIDPAISFVQSLEYTSDSVTAGFDEYQRYPVETLVDQGGDCEDTAILLGSLLKHMGHDVRGVLLPGHMALAVKLDKPISGSYYTLQDSRFYYIETTGSGWRLGQTPEEHQGEQAKLVPLSGYPCLNFEFKTFDVEHAEDMFVYTVHNSGDAPAEQIRFDVEFVDNSGKTVTGKRFNKADLEAGTARREMTRVPLPRKDIPVKVRTSAYLGQELHVRQQTPLLTNP